MVDPAVEDKIMAAEPQLIEEKQSVSGRRHLFGRRKPLHAALGSGKIDAGTDSEVGVGGFVTRSMKIDEGLQPLF
ncbi:hypothetical protein HanIR_Chr06g0286001 [Helianthus annuus]|nr:hypothetical protein HanIR_Chr06g0286001 [Helianthus annuus]